MTDKEVIIDGYTIKDLKDLLFTGQKMAISNKTFEALIYELKRKEQELEQLKEDLRIETHCIQCPKALENCKLHAENEKLKELIEDAKASPLCFQCKEEDCIRKERDRYEQALEDVKNICEPINCKNPEDCYMNKPDYYGEVYGCEPDDWKEPKQLTGCPSAVARVVLKIINEVLKDE